DIIFPSFTSVAEAHDWYTLERSNLMTATRAAANAGLHEEAWRLAATLHHIYRILGPIDDWRVTTEFGLRAARRTGSRSAEAELLESMATVCVKTHKLADGARYFDMCLEARRETGDRLGEAATLNGLGQLNLRRRNLTDAERLFNECLAIARELDDDLWQAVARGNLGVTAYQLLDNTTAIEFALRNLEYHETVGNLLGQGDSLHALARSYRELGHTSKALDAIKKAIEIARKNQNSTWEAYWLIEYGHIERATGRVFDSLTSYQRATVLHRQHGDLSREAQALDGAGLAYRNLERPKDSADFHRLAVSIYRETRDLWLLGVSLSNLAAAVELLGDAEKARQFREESLISIATFDDPRAQALRRQVRDELGTSDA
ncbi:tetratricopeptide repeat protein, partial [Amycolatopsis sp.]|uniref:tetratricopeptide repeat protein n=1 Tax=Amycolatopsis sp. TaxID=37632 RepID=UPI002D7FD840